MDPKSQKHAISIENVHRRATRIIRNLKGATYSERLLKIGLPTLEYRRARADVIQVYKLLNKLDKTANELLEIRENNTTRGHSKKLFKPKAARLNIRKNHLNTE